MTGSGLSLLYLLSRQHNSQQARIYQNWNDLHNDVRSESSRMWNSSRRTSSGRTTPGGSGGRQSRRRLNSSSH